MKHNGKPIEIVYIPFPEGAQGYVLGMTSNQPDKYLIMVDSTRCRILQYRALGHELAHIYLNHHTRQDPVAELELEAESQQWNYYRAYRSGALAHET